MTMKSIPREELLAYAPEYFRKLIPGDKACFTALDILAIDGMSLGSKLYIVVRGDLAGDKALHEFACRCAERALSRVGRPDPRSIAAIAAKRAWLRGEITDEALAALRANAMDSEIIQWRNAARKAAQEAANDCAWMAAMWAAHYAQKSALLALWRTESWKAAKLVEDTWQVDELKKMLREDEA